MKELSIEEKAKRYDEAIKRAKNTIEVNQTIPDIVECVESLFPELKESEDEKIRKDILDCIKYMKHNYCIPSRYTSKQYNTWIAWLKKQGEQGVNGSEREIPNSSWSEESERNLDWLITVCERIHYKSDPQVSPESALMLREWLKSLRPQNRWKPSDKQMKAIGHICDGDYNVDLDILDSIYRDFKKLREE